MTTHRSNRIDLLSRPAPVACAVSAALLAFTIDTNAAQLEEVLVTAQKRVESLQDVPIAITAVSGDAINSGGFSRMEDLAPALPNFQFAEAVSGSDNIFMRGIGSGPNFGFEQAVGLVVDGYFFGRSRFGRATFLDLERVEILKGPQGALIGKNTSGGAINVTTAKPTNELSGWISANYEFEADEGYTVEGAVSGPLTDSLTARLAVRYDDRDGWVENVATGEDDQQVEDLTARLHLAWDISETFSANLMYQYGDLDHQGRTRQLSKCGQILRAQPFFPLLVAKGEDCKANDSRNINPTHNGEGRFEGFETEFDFAGLTLNWDLGAFTLSSLTGWAQYEVTDEVDIDATFIEFGGYTGIEDYKQWSQEFRITSNGEGSIDYIGGIFLQSTEQDVDFLRHFPALPPPLSPSSDLIRTHQESDTYAFFGQVTWHVTDTWDVTLGGRYTTEDKDAQQFQTPTALYTDVPIVLVPPFGPAAASHVLDGDRSESNFSPTLNVQWRPTDDAMFYGSVRRGFKGGGFDMQLDGNQDQAEAGFEFEDEDVLAYELGAKLYLADGAAQLNLAAFRTEIDNLQVSSLDSETVTFNVGNAATAISQGVEVDFKWAATDNLTLVLAAAYLDAYYDDFPNAPCNADQLLGGRCPDPANQQQDLSDEPLQYAPETAAMMSAEYVWPLTGSLELTGFVQMLYQDDIFLSLDLDPNASQDSYTKWNARFTLRSSAQNWEVSVIGRNLTDESTVNFANDALGGPFMAGSYFAMVESPRAVSLQARLFF
jgi:iron complex outermembrane recepter protein